MAVQVRHYNNNRQFTGDFHRVRDFLIRINREKVISEGFLWGRWEWMFSLSFLDASNLDKIGVWEDNGTIVALATYECGLGNAWLIMDPAYQYLKKDMLMYAMENLHQEGKLKVLIDDRDGELQEIASQEGFRPTQEREQNSYLPLTKEMCYQLPEGYRIVSMAEEYDLKKYNRVLWRGFNHEGEPPETEEMLENRRLEQSGPHADMSLKIAVAAPDGSFVAYCGMWYEKGMDYALVEPVATDPDYRMLGLGKAAVLEGVNRCKSLGAKTAYVGSSQQFYYNIGFYPCSTQTWWEKKES